MYRFNSTERLGANMWLTKVYLVQKDTGSMKHHIKLYYITYVTYFIPLQHDIGGVRVRVTNVVPLRLMMIPPMEYINTNTNYTIFQ